LPIVDPRGLVTPFFDSWSIDVWIIKENGEGIYPAESECLKQTLDYEGNLSINTQTSEGNAELKETAEVKGDSSGSDFLSMNIKGSLDGRGFLVIALRPFNPEGVSFIHKIKTSDNRRIWEINAKNRLILDKAPDRVILSNYQEGDFHQKIQEDQGERESIKCSIGMASGGALYPLQNSEENIEIQIPLTTATKTDLKEEKPLPPEIWDRSLEGVSLLNLNESRYTFLYESSLRTLLLHSSGKKVLAGPYTYKHFWVRDAVIIGYALLKTGKTDKTANIIDQTLQYQRPSGYIRSQNGEWDSNGQVLWLINELEQVTNTDKILKWEKRILRAGEWIIRKRLSEKGDEFTDGLMPAGFSAEHLGPNDNYYWDTFWSIAGLSSASVLCRKLDRNKASEKFLRIKQEMLKSAGASLHAVESKLATSVMPASPHRRPDSGCIGSLNASYPLRIMKPDDNRITETVDYLFDNCMVNKALFHDISHSGINPYLTLHIAQAMLRNNDRRYRLLVDGIADLASDTGQWPEGIHPQLKTGCMGDGEHVWAASEWLLMIRNMFIREEVSEDKLILCSGIYNEWLKKGETISFGPSPTKWGNVTLDITSHGDDLVIRWSKLKNKCKTIEIIIQENSYHPEPEHQEYVLKNFFNRE
ncbi:MAG: hypothetical protein ACOCSE_03350, partial [Chitinivibrionales bacterium]